MKNSVKVGVHPETKAAITINAEKPEYATMRVDQEVISMENGFLNKTKRSDFITGKTADLQAIGYFGGQELPGQIVREEALVPFFEGQAPKKNPSTNEVILLDGKQVYFQDRYTEDLSAKDSLLAKSASKVTASTNVQASAAIN